MSLIREMQSIQAFLQLDFNAWEIFNQPVQLRLDEPDDPKTDGEGNPIYPPLPNVQFWTDGLSQEEMDAIHNLPQCLETDAQKLIRLEKEKVSLENRLTKAESAILTLMDAL